MDPSSGEIVWARQPLPEGTVKSAGPRWHRVALVNEITIHTVCDRVFLAPLDLRSDVPDGDDSCPICVTRATERDAARAEPL